MVKVVPPDEVCGRIGEKGKCRDVLFQFQQASVKSEPRHQDPAPSYLSTVQGVESKGNYPRLRYTTSVNGSFAVRASSACVCSVRAI